MGANPQASGRIAAGGRWRARAWWKTVRGAFFPASLLPVLMGTVTALEAGEVSSGRFILAAAGVLCYHAGSNLFNDLYDELNGTDRLNKYYSFFNGGSRVLQEGQVSFAALRRAAILLYAAGCLCCLVLAATGGGPAALALGAAGLLGGYFYSAPPLQLAGTAWGEAVIGLVFGPLLAGGTEVALTGRLPARTLLLALPLGFLITAVILINEFPDLEADRLAGKNTLVVRMGRRRSMRLFGLLLFFAFFFLTGNIFLWRLPGAAWLPLLALAPAARAYLLGRKFYADPRRLLPACAATIATHFLAGLLLVLSTWLGRQGGI